MSTSPITITLQKKTISDLDQVRGITKRSTLIQQIISEYLKKNGQSHSKNTPDTTQGDSDV